MNTSCYECWNKNVFLNQHKNFQLITLDITAENDLMITEIRRLEHAIQATEIPTHIARDCLGNRQRRIDTDLVQDDAENQILKVN